MSKKPKLPKYKEMKDTPWISQARDIAGKGGEGILQNYNKVNVFDEPTRQSLKSRVDNMYSRALSDFDRNYRDTMQQYANRNYSQFGTLNATPAAYRTDLYNLQEQRKLADLAYNKAQTYDDVVNNELNRRYNTLNLFNTMYQYGNIPYKQDVNNWQIRNQNLDRQYYNDLAKAQSGFSFSGLAKGALSGASAGSAFGPWGTAIGAIGGAAMGGFGNS